MILPKVRDPRFVTIRRGLAGAGWGSALGDWRAVARDKPVATPVVVPR